MFASEIILGNFAVESLTPIVIASVLADVVQEHIGEHRFEPAFRELQLRLCRRVATIAVVPRCWGCLPGWPQPVLSSCLYRIEDIANERLIAQVVATGVRFSAPLVGSVWRLVPAHSPPTLSQATLQELPEHSRPDPAAVGRRLRRCGPCTLHLDVPSRPSQPPQESASLAEATQESCWANSLAQRSDQEPYMVERLNRCGPNSGGFCRSMLPETANDQPHAWLEAVQVEFSRRPSILVRDTRSMCWLDS